MLQGFCCSQIPRSKGYVRAIQISSNCWTIELKGVLLLVFHGPRGLQQLRSLRPSQEKRCRAHWLPPSPACQPWGLQGESTASSCCFKGPIWHPLDSGPRATGNVARTSNFKSRSHSFLRVTLGPLSHPCDGQRPDIPLSAVKKKASGAVDSSLLS